MKVGLLSLLMAQKSVRMPVYREYELELRRQFLRTVVWGLSTVFLLYLAAALIGLINPKFFPWDALIAIFWIAIAILLYRRGTSRSMAIAASWVVAGVTILAVVYSQQFGLRHPITALFIICIILAGILISGSFLRFWTVLLCLFVLLWGYNEMVGLHENVADPISNPTELWQITLLWSTFFVITGGLMWLFAYTLERGVRVSRGRTAALTRTLNALSEEPELDTYLRQILSTAVDLFQARSASIFLIDPNEEKLDLRMSHEQSQPSQERRQVIISPSPALGLSDKLWQELSQFRGPIAVNDVLQDERISDKQPYIDEGIASMLLVTLVQDHVITGCMIIDRSSRQRFRHGERDLAQALAQQASLGMQLFTVAEQGREKAILEERNRIAREIHDTLAQGFTGIILQLDMAKYSLPHDPDAVVDAINRAVILAKESLEEARRSVWSLHPQALESQDLPTVLERIADQLTAETGISSKVEVIGTPYRLSQTTEGELLRIGQQGITNALRHAGATMIDLQLIYLPQKFTLIVHDDGRGFDTQQDQGSGFGMKSMNERADRIQANLKITPLLMRERKLFVH